MAQAVKDALITLLLCGDVMLGRGIDQALPHPGDALLHERFVRDAQRYVELAEAAHGEIDTPVGWDYVWGDALGILDRVAPEARIINLETSITSSDDWDRAKGIHYRMHPANAPVLAAAKIDACVLANNHVLDWGPRGLVQTLDTLEQLPEAEIKTAGAGRDAAAARAPAVLEMPDDRRLLIFAAALPTSGVPRDWRATDDRPGVCFLPDLGDEAFDQLRQTIETHARDNDLIVVSLHWGGNWGYDIPDDQRRFAHRLIDEAGADLIHGHSSHHPKGIEVYQDRLILYGCGDLLNDYEGIGGHDEFRPDLTALYLPQLDPATGRLTALRLAPLRIRNLQLQHAPEDDTAWLAERLTRESKRFGVRVQPAPDGMLHVTWDRVPNPDKND
jgi:poly-gamma-glutamate synthesis protein (capsule biosynthesis protein)